MRDALTLALFALSLFALLAYQEGRGVTPAPAPTYALIGPTLGVPGSLDVLDSDLSLGDCYEAMRAHPLSACEIER